MKTLISNTSFGELCKSKEKEFPTRNVYLSWYEEIRTNYDKFLKQPLNIGMLVPCDDDGNVLEEYKRSEAEILADKNSYCRYISKEEGKWHKAKEKVLFEGFELVRFIEKENPCYVVSNGENEVTFHIGLYNFSKGVDFANTIEDLIHIQPILTESAIKQI
jgi:hypothetical protein